MTFAHKYQKTGGEQYFHTEEFRDDAATFILAVGTTRGLGLISRIDSQGIVEWEQTYEITGLQEELIFSKVIQIKPLAQNESYEYVVYGSTRSEHFLLNISVVNGQVMWANEVIWQSTQQETLQLTSGIAEHCFYLSISNLSDRFYLGKFDVDGNLQTGRQIILGSSGVQIKALLDGGNRLTAVGKRVQGSSVGLWLEFDAQLSTIEHIETESPEIEIHDVQYAGGLHRLSGYSFTDQMLFLADYDPTKGFQNVNLLEDTRNHQSKVQLSGGGTYLLQYNSGGGALNFIDTNTEPVWRKELVLNGGENGLSKIHYIPDTNRLTTDAFNPVEGSLVVHTHASFESCRTRALPRARLLRTEIVSTQGNSSNNAASLQLNSTAVQVQQAVSNTIAECPLTTGIPVEENTEFQSPSFYLQSAGSNGSDSTTGIHNRWLFRGALGDKHLPKRNYAANSNNFNKPNDVVRLYRTRYRKFAFDLDLFSAPTVVDSANKFWIYRQGQRDIYVYFKNEAAYTSAANVHNPLSNPSAFYHAYGNHLIEVENKEELFFAVQIFRNTAVSGNYVETETLTVADPAPFAPRYLSNRKKFQSSADFQNARLVAENGCVLRFRPVNCVIRRIHFEFYTDFVQGVNQETDWTPLGEFGLSLDDAVVSHLLEPTAGSVHGSWLRYSEGALVNTANYLDRWNGQVDAGDRNMKDVVTRYIELSDDLNNPKALEAIPVSEEPELSMDISNLDILNMAAMDFHLARMLGLGVVDQNASIDDVTYMYAATYTSLGDLEDGLGPREVQHLAVGLPTSKQDSRLPKAVEVDEILPGAFTGTEGEMSNLTDEEGFTPDGLFRFVSIFAVPEAQSAGNPPFYQSNQEFASHMHTLPVFAGLRYRKNAEANWQKPELSNNPKYNNAVPSGQSPFHESRHILIPETGLPLFVHMQTVSGTHYYNTYGINWFSRASFSQITEEISTALTPSNPLLPPSDVHPFLIRSEFPPLFTSQSEQLRYAGIAAADKTLVRLLFEYHSHHDLVVHRIPLDSTISDADILLPANNNDPEILFPDNEEILADEIEIRFRDHIPGNISGKVMSISEHETDTHLSVINTGTYLLASQEPPVSVQPVLGSNLAPNYVGGIFMLDGEQFIIHSISGSVNPTITVFKKEAGDSITTNQASSQSTASLLAPVVTGDGFFMAIENMQNEVCWPSVNPLQFKVNIGANWSIKREVIYNTTDDGDEERFVEKSRGIWADNALVETINEDVTSQDENGNVTTDSIHNGLYKITFNNYSLAQHPQHNANGNSVEWHQGIVRAFATGALENGIPKKTRRVLKVEKIENIGAASDLVVYCRDMAFPSLSENEKIQTGSNISVNFYPGYRVYLYKDDASSLNAAHILPPQEAEEEIKYTIFSLRSHDSVREFRSPIGAPASMFAQKIIEALQPEQPLGPLYATRPDFYGRSTYTFTTTYAHQPYGVLFYRGNDEAFLNAIYEKSTILQIREALKALGGNNEEYFTNRWTNFVDFVDLELTGDYKVYPPAAVSPDGYKFPNPDKEALFAWANQILAELGEPEIQEEPGTLAVGDPKILNFVKGAIFQAMNPLTEVPIIYGRISANPGYVPQNKKQVIKDANGHVLPPNSPLFDMAPMAKRSATAPHQSQFTDFTLDGTSVNIYYYAVRELSSQMKMGEFSHFLGPIKLINSFPAEPPEIKRIIPILENATLGTVPHIKLEVNAYPELQNIKRIEVYRAKNFIDAKSVRTMDLAKVYNLSEAELSNGIWNVSDDFSDLNEVPFGDGLFYRVVAHREVEYRDQNNNLVVDFAPSHASKISASVIVETSRPAAPLLRYGSKPIDPTRGTLAAVRLFFDKTCYNGKYHIYKMNSQGNWNRIFSVQTNEQTTYIELLDTSYASGVLETQDDDGNKIFHHFKAVAENTAGLMSVEENILTIYRAEEWIDVDTLPL
jgi:hypothetical protein